MAVAGPRDTLQYEIVKDGPFSPLGVVGGILGSDDGEPRNRKAGVYQGIA